MLRPQQLCCNSFAANGVKRIEMFGGGAGWGARDLSSEIDCGVTLTIDSVLRVTHASPQISRVSKCIFRLVTEETTRLVFTFSTVKLLNCCRG